MNNEYVTPLEAINRLMAMHYPGRKKGDPKRVRQALIGALQSGHVEWCAQKWFEEYSTESDAMYDENGGWTTDRPSNGWPSDFWQLSLVADSVCWKNNYFNTWGVVSLLNARHKVRRWLQQNDEAYADWQRAADEVEINWSDVNELLAGSGWQAWIPKGKKAAGSPLAAHYQNALIAMIAKVGREPEVLATRQAVYEALFNEFESGGRVPDESEMRKLTRQIWNACQPPAESLLPPD